jgi:NADH-quinone oxidoreductase subunit J
MTVADIAFYAFAVVLIGAAFLVVVSRNPVHSVLWLILTFISAAGLFVLLGAEFLAMLLLIVYVRAVAELILFVVKMLDVDFAALKAEMAKYIPLAGLVGLILLMQLVLVYGAWTSAEGVTVADGPIAAGSGRHNTDSLGLVLYDQYFVVFQLSGLILLVAMIGAIALTLRHRVGIKRQDVLAQMYRDPAKAMELKDVKPGQGL